MGIEQKLKELRKKLGYKPIYKKRKYKQMRNVGKRRAYREAKKRMKLDA